MELSTTIPFISTGSPEVISEWVNALRVALPGYRIDPYNEMGNDGKLSCTVAIVANPDPMILRTLPNLVWVHSVWAGVERLVAELGHTSLKIVRLVDPSLGEAMAEAVLAWTLYLHRDMPAYMHQQRREVWHQRAYVAPGQKTVGLLGLGALGKIAAKSLLASGFNVLGWSRSSHKIESVETFSGAAELKCMLARCDILVCLLPLTTKTEDLLNAEYLACLPKGASLINFARGPIINDNALRDALDSGYIDHAVLDVFDVEPLPAMQWQWRHPRVTVLPHCSAPTNRQTASKIVANRILRYLEDGTIPPCIDLDNGY